MVVAAFLSGLPLTPRSPPYVYALPALALFLGQDPLWVLPACTCTVSWAVGDSGLCHPLTVQGTGSLGVPLFLPE